MKILKSIREHRIISLFRKHVANRPEAKLTRVRGDLNCRTLMLAPPPSKEEMEQDLPLAGDTARMFHELLLEQGFSTERNAVVLACALSGPKACKANTQPVAELAHEYARLGFFDLFICVGEDAFKYIYGRGRKPPMTALIGRPVYIAQAGNKPVFVFPNISLLAPPPANLIRREIYRWEARRNEAIQQISRVAQELVIFQKRNHAR